MDDEPEPEVDPEVQADLELRERSKRDQTRTRGRGVYEWSTPEMVEFWTCRNRCGGSFGVTAEVVFALGVHNRELARRGEPAIEPHEVGLCDRCRKRRDGGAADRNRRHIDAMASLIRELRGGTTVPEKPGPAPEPYREYEIMQALRLMGHDDVDGCVKAIREARGTGGAKAARKKGV